MISGGFVKTYHCLLDWEWYGDVNVTRVFIHCLLKANWKDGKFQGIEIPRGSFVSSFEKLSEECSLSIKATRRAIKKLESTGEISHKGHSKFSVFTVNNYSKFQGCGVQEFQEQESKDIQRNHQRDNQMDHQRDYQRATIEEKKEYKEKKNIRSNIYKPSANKFNSYSQRVYDFDSITKRIMEE